MKPFPPSAGHAAGRRAGHPVRTALAAGVAALVLTSGPAAAQFVERGGSAEGPRGGSAEWQVQRGDGTSSRERSATGPGGRTWLRERSHTADPDAGTATGTVGATGPAGNTVSAERSATANDDGTYAVEGTRTTRSGQTRTWTGTLVPVGE